MYFMNTQDYSIFYNLSFFILEKSHVQRVLVLFKTNSTEVKDDTANLSRNHIYVSVPLVLCGF